MWVHQAVSLIKGIKRSEVCQWHRSRPLCMAGWLEAQICFGIVIPNRTWPRPAGVSWQENNVIQTLEVRASYRRGQQGSWCALYGSCLESLREANDTKGHFGEPTYGQRGDFLSPDLKERCNSHGCLDNPLATSLAPHALRSGQGVQSSFAEKDLRSQRSTQKFGAQRG